MNKIIDVKLEETSIDTLREKYYEVARKYRAKAKAESTKYAYRKDLEYFASWCAENGMTVLPSSPETISYYACWCAEKGLRATTIKRRVAAIKYANKLAGFKIDKDSPEISEVMQGIRNDLGELVNQKLPITIEMLKKMLDFVPDSLSGKRDHALLITLYSGAFRASEALSLSIRTLTGTPKGYRAKLEKSKTDQEGKGRNVSLLDGSGLEIKRRISEWIDASKIVEGYIFRPFKKGSKEVRDCALSVRSALNIVNKYLELAGYDSKLYGCHSFRSGAATDAALNGSNIFEIQRMMGHSSMDTTLIYIRLEEDFDNHPLKGIV